MKAKNLATILEARVTAALRGHDLGPFEPVDPEIGGWQSFCRGCGRSILLGDMGLMYYVLGERCVNQV